MKLKYTPTYYLLVLGFLLGLVIYSGYLFRSHYMFQQELIAVQENRYSSYLLATQLRQSSDELTRLVRTYAATGNSMYEKQFWEVLAIRKGESPLPEHYDRVYWEFLAIENNNPPYQPGGPVSLKELMKNAGFTLEEFTLLAKSQENSDELVKLEKIAMNAMKGKYQDKNGAFSISGAPDRLLAIDILHGDEYHRAKIDIMSPINQFYEKLDQRTKESVNHAAVQLKSTLHLQVFVLLLVISTIFVLMFSARRYHEKMMQTLNQRVFVKTEALTVSNRELQRALDEIKTLRGIIPICSYCHSIRNDKGAWEKMESYIAKHSEASFSHGVCPKCITKARADAGLD